MEKLIKEALEGQVKSYKREIEQLTRDMGYVSHDVSVHALQYQISLRKASIEDIELELNKD